MSDNLKIEVTEDLEKSMRYFAGKMNSDESHRMTMYETLAEIQSTNSFRIWEKQREIINYINNQE